MTKIKAREKAQWLANFYHRPYAVLVTERRGFVVEVLAPCIPASEIVEVLTERKEAQP